MRTLIAIPVYNERRHVRQVLDRVLNHAGNVLVVDDGSSDGTTQVLTDYPIDLIRHAVNRGYGQSTIDAFRWAIAEGYDWVITMDCDEQHEPEQIPDFLAAAQDSGFDIISGSRYLKSFDGDDLPPVERRRINTAITDEINQRLGLRITDAFCGFKAYRVSALRRFSLSEQGYALPMQFWVRAVATGARITEIPVRLIYNDLNRSFGEALDNADVRLAHYRDVLHDEIRRFSVTLPAGATAGLVAASGNAGASAGSSGAKTNPCGGSSADPRYCRR
ncbi:MAG: glycosyltransferase family 2 protein [Planctomycetota bacterium]|nr:glycosyltransferase family 2 protein [Planctomycetota bacterium]